MSTKKELKGKSLQKLVDEEKLDPGYHLQDYTQVGGIISKPEKNTKKEKGE